MTNPGPDVRTDMTAMLAAVGITVTAAGKARARAKLEAAQARCTPEMYDAWRAQLGLRPRSADARREEGAEPMTAQPVPPPPPGTPGDGAHVPAEEIARRQGVKPVESVEELFRPDTFESDDELDEFLADLYASRRAGMA